MGTGSSRGSGSQGSRDFEQDELFGGDPSIAPGLPRPEGWRVRMPDGSGAWDKTGPLDTDWTPVGGGGGGGVTSVIGIAPIQVSTVAGVATVRDLAPDASWPIDRMRVYAVDLVNGDDTRAGFADMAGTTAGDYATACAAAGAVAKKTIAGLAAIFPRVGNGRLVEIVSAAGDYSAGAGIETVLSGVVGYASGCPLVRGTSTNPTAGAVAFAGTQADVIYHGAVTIPGLFAAGYVPGVGSTSSVLGSCAKVGGGAPAWGAEPAVPTGWRIRFAVNTATVALRNVCRQVCRVSSTDTLSLQTVLPAVPATDGSDFFFCEQAGVVLPGFTTPSILCAPPNGATGMQWCGLRSAAGWTFGDSSILFSDCGAGSITCNSRQLATLATLQNLAHPVLGVLTVGGGFRSEASAQFSNAQLALFGLVSVTDTLIGNSVGAGQKVSWGPGCAARKLAIYGLNGNTAVDDTNEQPNIGSDSSSSVGIPRIFGGVSGHGLTYEGCKIRFGQIDFINVQGSCFRPNGENNAVFTGAVRGTNVDEYGIDLRNSSGGVFQFAGVGNLPAGALGQILFGGGSLALGPKGDWSHLTLQDVWDTNGNHLIDYTAGGNYVSTMNPSVFSGQLGNPLPDANIWLGIVRYGSGGPLYVPAKADSIAHASGIAGVLLSNFDSSFCLLGGLSGYQVLQFDAAPATGVIAYLSGTTAAMATTDVPPLSLVAAKLRLGVVVQVLGGNRAIVRMAPELQPTLADGLP